MCKKIGCLTLLVCLILTICIPAPANAAFVVPAAKNPSREEAMQPSALLLYDSRYNNKNEKLAALYNLLRVFCSKIAVLDIGDYNKDSIAGVDYVFIVAEEGKFSFNSEFNRDLSSFKGTVCWIGGQPGEYFRHDVKTGFKISGFTDEIAEMRYAFSNSDGKPERIFTGKSLHIPQLEILKPEEVQCYGVLYAGTTQFPYALKNGNTWFITMFKTDTDLLFVFYDVLNFVFNSSNLSEPKVYLKLDNVSPLIGLEKLQKIAGWLKEEKVPFIMVLTPVFANSNVSYMTRFTDVVKQMQRDGGTAVLGNLIGWKPADIWQQYSDGYAPLSGAQEMEPETLVNRALQSYLQHGIYPVAFSGPANMFFDNELNHVLRHFSTVIQSGEWTGPFQGVSLDDKAWSGRYIPHFLKVENPSKAGVENYIDGCDRLMMVNNSISTVAFDCDSDMEILKKTLGFLKKRKVPFSDFRDMNSRVDYNEIKLSVENGRFIYNGSAVSISSDVNTGSKDDTNNLSKSSTVYKPTGVNKAISLAITFVLTIITAFVLIFAVSFVINKRIDKRKHLR